MSTLKAIKSAYSTGCKFLPFLFLNPKGVKSRSISEIAKLLLITSVLLLGYNISFAQPGSLDTSFDTGMGPAGGIYSTFIQSDGKIIIGGIFNSYNGKETNHIARLNTDGSLDTTFDSGMEFSLFNSINTISIQSNGKIIIGGNFNSYNGTKICSIVRLNPDGSLDTTFDPGSGANAWVTATSIQSDGKIIIGGNFNLYNGTERNGIARLLPDGSLDTSFVPGMAPNTIVESVSLQSDGKIIIGGSLKAHFGSGLHHIIRLNTDGSFDTSFDSRTESSDLVLATSLQSDGKIIIGGRLRFHNGIAISPIARLNTDGSLDSSFDPGTGPDNLVYAAAIQSDGKILISGEFSSYNGMERIGLARLYSDGSLDTSFDPGTGPEWGVSTVSIQSDGKIIIGGGFRSYNGTEINRIARLYAADATSVNPPLKEESNTVKIFPNPFRNTTTLLSDIQLKNATLTIFNSIGQTVKQITAINIGAGNSFTLNRDQLPTGLYFIQLSQDNQVIMNDKLVITD